MNVGKFVWDHYHHTWALIVSQASDDCIVELAITPHCPIFACSWQNFQPKTRFRGTAYGPGDTFHDHLPVGVIDMLYQHLGDRAKGVLAVVNTHLQLLGSSDHLHTDNAVS